MTRMASSLSLAAIIGAGVKSTGAFLAKPSLASLQPAASTRWRLNAHRIQGGTRSASMEFASERSCVSGNRHRFSADPPRIAGVSKRATPSGSVGEFGRAFGQPSSPGVVAAALAVLLMASTTEEDILAAMRGLDGYSPVKSQETPNVSLEVPAQESRTELSSSPRRADSKAETAGHAALSGRGAGEASTNDLGLGKDTDLMRSLTGSPRQAEPRTHGM